MDSQNSVTIKKMNAIGIVDDREDVRSTMKISIELALSKFNKEWIVVDTPPFVEKDEYYPWIKENGVCVLLMDERLNEEMIDGETSVDYTGHELVQVIREKEKELPIIAITSHSDDEDLQENLSYFDNIVDRNEFNLKSEDYVNRFIRFGQKFIDQYRSELLEISSISDRIAQGSQTDKDLEDLAVLQTKLSLGYQDNTLKGRSEWLNEFESSTEELEQLKDKLWQYLSSLK
ncbi:response regulator [Hymenobacter sp. 15J16-1T3B]|uniref:response regulator n=1 Tax=Hymenobacter sp. 15J16-1T3B TaxID=2886941 RepID=UPI001D111210|nr:response regulator [Hymenobacter sp. 15J16-1T3B]MCC3160867.1 response regulator [Hymenobacter sp. 15J16-1T3B]